jgi:hypothetical protein
VRSTARRCCSSPVRLLNVTAPGTSTCSATRPCTRPPASGSPTTGRCRSTSTPRCSAASTASRSPPPRSTRSPPPGFVQSQFSNLLRGLLAVGGWLGGDAVLLRVNPLLAGAALLGFHGVAREDVGRAWALVPVAVLGVSAPMLHFGRNAKASRSRCCFCSAGSRCCGRRSGAATRRAARRPGPRPPAAVPAARRPGSPPRLRAQRRQQPHRLQPAPPGRRHPPVAAGPLERRPRPRRDPRVGHGHPGGGGRLGRRRPDPAPREPRLDSPAHAETPVP